MKLTQEHQFFRDWCNDNFCTSHQVLQKLSLHKSLKSWFSWVNFNLSQFWHNKKTWDWDYLTSINFSMTYVMTLFVHLYVLYKWCNYTSLWLFNPDELNQKSDKFQINNKNFSMFLKNCLRLNLTQEHQLFKD